MASPPLDAPASEPSAGYSHPRRASPRTFWQEDGKLNRANDQWSAAAPLPVTSNLLLRQLTAADRSLVEPHLELQWVSCGTLLFDEGDPVEHAYFPVDTVIALEQACRIEVALAGREGMAGWTAASGHCRSPYRAVVRCRDGQILRIAVQRLLAAMSANPKLRSTILQYMVVCAVHMAEGLSAHSHHRLEAAIARWLLLRHDRLGGDWIPAHHQEIADNLGARRASVTDCLHVMEGDLHIRCRRGRILVRNRADCPCFTGACWSKGRRRSAGSHRSSRSHLGQHCDGRYLHCGKALPRCGLRSKRI